MGDPLRGPGGESLWQRVRRRKVVQWGAAYGAAAWGFLQGLEYVGDSFGWPTELRRLAIIALSLGLPIVMVVAWYHGDRGEQRVTRVELAILTLLFLFGGGVFWRYQHFTATQPPGAPAVSRPAAVANERSIAVLPFVDMSADKDQEYFADGMAEELLNLLTQVPQLRVTSRGSAFSFKGQNLEVPEIAKRLNVAHVLEGSVRMSGTRARVTAQLIDARSDTQVWSHSWDRELGDIFAVQDEIAAAVVTQLKVKLLGEAPKARPVNPKAYALFLQARQLSNRMAYEGYPQAEVLYRQALAIDPDYPPALTGLAQNYFRRVGVSQLAADEGYALAREAVDRAIAIDPDCAPAYALAGWLDIYQSNDLARAARELGRAVSLEPTSAVVLGKAAALLYHLGRLDEAIALGQYEVARDPQYAPGYNNLGIRYFTARRWDDTIASFRTVLRLSPDAMSAHSVIGQALLMQGKTQAALEAVEKESDATDRMLGLTMVRHALGDRAESDRVLSRLIAEHGRESPTTVACALAYRGEADRAFEWLDKALESGNTLVAEVVFQPYFDRIRSDPRWLPFLRRIGRAPDQLAAIKFDVKVPN